MFENLIFEPIANGGQLYEIEKPAPKLLETSGDGTGFFYALEEVLYMMSLFVETFVILRWADFVGLGRDACLQSQRLKERSEIGAAVGLVRQNRSGVLPGNQLRSRLDVVSVSRAEKDAHPTSPTIDQGVDLGVGSSFGFADALEINAVRATESVLVDLRTGGVDRPKLASGGTCERVENLIPDAGLAPSLPSRVDGGVRCEDAQRPPRAALAHPEKHREKNLLGIDRRSSSLGYKAGRGSTRSVVINFFSRLALAASFGWMRIFTMPHHARC